jgi:predicted acylesterase/phospholipase RssA
MLLVRSLRCLALSTLLCGCATIHRPRAALPEPAVARRDAERVSRAARDSVIERLARRLVRRGDATLDVLLLSGGGQHGAYAAGFLRAWAQRTSAPAPRFDLVTGISTGALQSPLVLLGTPTAYDSLAALYRDAGDRFPSRVDFSALVRRTGGIVSNAALARTIRAVLDSSMQAAIIAAHRDDRVLAVGTTDMDIGLQRAWLLGDVLTRDTVDIARIFIASAAIPGVLPPVLLADHVHGDGGVGDNFLPLLSLADWQAVATRARALGVTASITVNLHAVLNIMPHAPLKALNPASRGALSSRSTVLLFWQQLPRGLGALETLARAVTATTPGVTMHFKSLSVPQEAETFPGAEKLFDGPYMRRLLELGAARAGSAAPWDLPRP